MASVLSSGMMYRMRNGAILISRVEPSACHQTSETAGEDELILRTQVNEILLLTIFRLRQLVMCMVVIFVAMMVVAVMVMISLPMMVMMMHVSTVVVVMMVVVLLVSLTGIFERRGLVVGMPVSLR